MPYTPDDELAPRIILVQHSDERPDNRVLRYLEKHGYAADIRQPYRGQSLPSPHEQIGGAVVFGRLYNAFDVKEHAFLREEYDFIDRCLETRVPLLGICLGAQMIAWTLGANVGPPATNMHEFGYYEIRPTPDAGDFLHAPLHVVQSHWHAFDLPAKAVLLASSELFPNQAFRIGSSVFGVQFHPEVTPAGFRGMQDRGAHRYTLPGVQTRDEQNRLMRLHDQAQAEWFGGFLSKLFPPLHS